MKSLITRACFIATIIGLSSCSSTKPTATSSPTRIGFVAGAGGFQKMAVTNQAFFDTLAEAGYSDGGKLDVVFRTADGDMARMPALVREVLDQNVSILVVSSSPGCAAAKAATTTVPVLCISVQDDPVKAGLTREVAKADGNVVGVYSYLPDGIPQQMDWLGRLRPGVKTFGVLFNPENATHIRLLSEWSELANRRDLKLVKMPVVKAADIEPAIKSAVDQHCQIAIGLLGADTYALRKEIAEAARAQNFPIAMDTPGGYTQLGGVAVIGVDIVPLYRKGARELMVPMLQGTSPSQLSWLGPDRVSVSVNRTAAQGFSIAVPSGVDSVQ
ncbi:ABC transporter substrate binding protein [Caballeronia sp. ATUFL_M2_KS44]|uniref:ABC transporter substrate binding protein n=1 Tax=Caballeronia sp. ATUFL_M2_KS44 TaxID=2921767 RepID=UPI0020289932